jgi:hypothetical protein
VGKIIVSHGWLGAKEINTQMSNTEREKIEKEKTHL